MIAKIKAAAESVVAIWIALGGTTAVLWNLYSNGPQLVCEVLGLIPTVCMGFQSLHFWSGFSVITLVGAGVGYVFRNIGGLLAWAVVFVLALIWLAVTVFTPSVWFVERVLMLLVPALLALFVGFVLGAVIGFLISECKSFDAKAWWNGTLEKLKIKKNRADG